MQIDTYLQDLITRMLDTAKSSSQSGNKGSETISWKALREAEKIDNPDVIPYLIGFIEEEKDKKKRDKMFFILGHVARNTGDLKALQYLLCRVAEETDKYVLSSLLDQIAKITKPTGTDLQPLIRLLKSDVWLIRQSAIQSLENSCDEIAETALLELTENTQDSFDLILSSAILNKIGTTRAIPYLEKHINSRKKDLKESARYAIEEILKRV
jgi:HEAT repeat protein